jgi:hypothetical protein
MHVYCASVSSKAYYITADAQRINDATWRDALRTYGDSGPPRSISVAQSPNADPIEDNGAPLSTIR